MKPHMFNFENFVSHADSVNGIVENIFLLGEVVRCQRDVILHLSFIGKNCNDLLREASPRRSKVVFLGNFFVIKYLWIRTNIFIKFFTESAHKLNYYACATFVATFSRSWPFQGYAIPFLQNRSLLSK